MARLLLADDHRLFLSGLRGLLDSVPSFDVVGSCNDGQAAVRLAEELEPDVVLIDVSMPGLNGIEATHEIVSLGKDIKVIVVSMHSDRRYVVRALKAGARGYLQKDIAFGDLKDAVNLVLNGGFALSPKINGAVIEEYLDAVNHRDHSPYNVITSREREVLQLVAEGLTTKEIASRLCLSVKTIETHRRHLMDALNVHSIAGLTLYAVREGIVDVT